MQEIGSGSNHRVAIDQSKNRVYMRFSGDILSSEAVSALPDEVKAACAALKVGFTCLADFTEMKLLGLPDLVVNVQSTIMAAGVRKVASVWSEEGFAKFLVDSSAQKVSSGAYEGKRKVFKNAAEAESWLDE
ncbi:MAG: hypothetical protein HY914_14410 [Desulfomonile tiedjei]|nr:hypothetical protein [Desulfomonile tiedjei]